MTAISVGVAAPSRRLPAVTGAVFGVTALVNLFQFAVPGTLGLLRRSPEGLHEQWWRTFTSLFVQDGGAAGTVFNLLALAVVGAVAEQVLSRRAWLLHYFGVGVAAELVGYAWQPFGGGNSIAVCGLVGAVFWAIRRLDGRLPRPLTTRWNRGLALAVPVGAVALAAVRDVHGAALLMGLATGLISGSATGAESDRASAVPGRLLARMPARPRGREAAAADCRASSRVSRACYRVFSAYSLAATARATRTISPAGVVGYEGRSRVQRSSRANQSTGLGARRDARAVSSAVNQVFQRSR